MFRYGEVITYIETIYLVPYASCTNTLLPSQPCLKTEN